MSDLLSLAVNLASKNRNFVALIGAGFSKDAGLPSGWDILIDTIKPFYLSENKESTSIEATSLNDKITNWCLNHEEYGKLGYSDILKLLHKGELERKNHLEKYFKNQQPGEAHYKLAEIVKMGLLRFIFTTNFDNLIEKALDEVNIDYDVIFSDEILKKTKSWDKVQQCRIYKLHGDYKVGKIIASIAREINKIVKIVVGGAHPTIDPAGTLKNDEFDFSNV